MKKLLASKHHDQVRAAYEFLMSQGVPVTVSEKGEQLEIWVIQASYFAHAKALLQEFKDNPETVQANTANTFTAPTASATPKANLWERLRVFAGPFTLVYAALVILVFIGLNTPASETIRDYLHISDYWNEWPWSQPWRFVTPALLHFSAVHIVFNLVWWVYLGGRFENLYGSTWLVLAWLSCAVISNVAQFIAAGPFFGGLSGVVYGLFGLAVVLAWQNPRHPLYLPPGLIAFMLIWLALGYSGLLWVNIANTAHTAGLLSGLGFGLMMRFTAWQRARS